jgi:very-short-patch-repair endonuclease
MWVIHSFDPDFHLRAGDLRFKLLQHVKDPSASIRLFEQESGKTESPFEMEVLKRLVNAGYQVKTQWQVGHYRIDMVVEGAGKKRLAVECDGDRYHTLDNLADDMERQTVLERLGWQFIRIRGSKFFRDPDSTMRPVFDTLTDLGIMPQGTSSSDATQNMDIINELDALIKAKADSDMAQGSVGAQESKSKRSWASPNQIKANQNGTLTNQVQDSLWAGADGLAS